MDPLGCSLWKFRVLPLVWKAQGRGYGAYVEGLGL